MNIRKEKITPLYAKMLLAKNQNPRQLKSWHVKEFVRHINEGTFLATPQGIALDKNGNLRDGQHRLAAVVESGVAVEMYVATEVGDDVVKYIDRGMRRTNNDVMGVDKRIGEMVTKLARIADGFQRPNEEALFRALKVFGSKAELLLSVCSAAKKGLNQTAVKVAVILNMMDYGDDVALQYAAFSSTDGIGCSPCVLALRNRIAFSPRKLESQFALCQAFYAFNPENAHCPKIIIRDEIERLKIIRARVRFHLLCAEGFYTLTELIEGKPEHTRR